MKKVLLTGNAQVHLSISGGYNKQLYFLFNMFKEFGYQIYYLMFCYIIHNNESYLKTYTYHELEELYKNSEYSDTKLLDDDLIKSILYFSSQNEERDINATIINNITDYYNIDLFVCLGDALIFSCNKENAYKVPSYYWYPCHFHPFSPIDYAGLNSFSNILSLSPSIKIELEKTFPNKNIYYLPHIVQQQSITMTKEEIRNKWNIPNDKYVVLIVCNLINEKADKYIVNRKGIDSQLIAFKQFNEKYKNSLLFIHSIKTKYDHLYPLEDLIHKLEFTHDNFIWNKNMLNEPELHELYKMSDILLNCTKSEGFGVPILEAQHYNINVITNHFTSMKEHNFQDNVVEPSTSSLNYGVSGIWITPSSFNIFEMMEQIYLNNSNNIIKQKRSNWIVNKLTNYTNIKNKLKKILQID